MLEFCYAHDSSLFRALTALRMCNLHSSSLFGIHCLVAFELCDAHDIH